MRQIERGLRGGEGGGVMGWYVTIQDVRDLHPAKIHHGPFAARGTAEEFAIALTRQYLAATSVVTIIEAEAVAPVERPEAE
jgi:hypothetical protein